MNLESYLALQNKADLSIGSENAERFVEILRILRSNESRIWIAGNGGSAATASHAVVDFTKTAAAAGQKSLRANALSENVALTTAFSNDVNFESSLGETLRSLCSSNDALMVISVSGTSPNLLYALGVARELGLKTLGLIGSKGSGTSNLYDECIVVDSDDYQIVENSHMTFIHWLVKKLVTE